MRWSNVGPAFLPARGETSGRAGVRYNYGQGGPQADCHSPTGHRVVWRLPQTGGMMRNVKTPKRRYPKEEFERRGDEIYERHIRPKLKPRDEGKFLAIDIETGEYELNEDQRLASVKLRSRMPDAQIWFVRVGSPYLHRFG